MTLSVNLTAPLGTLEAMHQAMEACIGEHETNGDNVNDITAWYGENGSPWCDMTITWAAWHSGNAAATCYGVKRDYTVDHAQAFADHGAWHQMTTVGASGIRAGDIVFYDWEGGKSISGIDHVGYVESVNGSIVNTIEGNISNVCERKQRPSDFIAGFGRPVYQAPPPVPPPVPVPTPVPTPVPAPVPAPTPDPTPAPVPSYVPYPGRAFFVDGQRSAIITAMGKRLVAEGCGKYYQTGPGPLWTDHDKANYQLWQRKLGYTGSDADGSPGKTSWDALRVPK